MLKMKKDVLLFQELTHRAWLARDTVVHKGWLVRVSESVTKRANSVMPISYHGVDLEKDISIVYKLYKDNNLPLIFQIPDYFEPPNLVEYLQNSGFLITDETIVMSTEIEQDNFSLDKDRFDVVIEHDVDVKWYQALKRLTDIDSSKLEGFRKIISRTSNAKITCSVMKDDNPIGIVLGVIEEPYIGIFDLVVHSDYRRQGIGEFIMRMMMSYAQKSKLRTMYLQVEANNLQAVKLYKKLNFQERYRYRYLAREIE